MGPLKAATLRDWTPIRARTAGGEPTIDWALIDAPFTEPFFEHTADRAMHHPFNLLFARRTTTAVLEEMAATQPALAPSGFIFHMSRCGSTLISQMLAALSATIVLSEPQPLDALLMLRRRAVIDDATLTRWFRLMLGALGRARYGERRFFVKFYAWHVLELPWILRCFPGVPSIFVFREPRAVLRSQADDPGPEVIAGTLDPSYFGIERGTAHFVPQGEYRARALRAFCDAALTPTATAQPRCVDYAGLPNAVFSDLLPFFGISASPAEVARMHSASGRDPKNAGEAFQPCERARDAPELELLAKEWLDVPYETLRSRAAAAR